ncbi:MAG: penicillin-binding protein 2 [bacterium]|nr:penicillin-binding protein 2 [bacterium]
MPVINPPRYQGNGSGPPPIRYDHAKRARIIYGLLLLVSAVFILRLFYLQVIRHDYYAKAALNSQLKEYQIPAERGVISAHNGSQTTPLVLNEIKYTLFADPVYVKEPEKHAVDIARVIGGDSTKIIEQLKSPDTRYVVLAKKLSEEQHKQITELDIAGIGTREASYRTYPQGSLAAQVLGFVNDEGRGQYGFEQAYDEKLRGKPGELKAITDARGVPLVSNPENIVTEAEPGEAVTLTLDIGMQRQLEEVLRAGLKRAESKSGSALIMDPNSGAIRAIANYPTYNPAEINNLKDLSALSNGAVTAPLEIGSIMKSLTVAAAIDHGVVGPDTAFYNEGYVVIGDHRITDVHSSQGTQTTRTTLVESLNTGAVWLLKQIGQGDINQRARQTWHSYMTKHYFLGQTTGVEQAGEAAGFIPSPEENNQGINVTYANTAFGQGMTATPLQMAAAYSSIINGGIFYQPRLVDNVRDINGDSRATAPVVKSRGVISKDASDKMVRLLEEVANANVPGIQRSGYVLGGKTGTAEIANLDTGLYYTDRFNGTYAGFIGGDRPEYVIVVRVNEPKIPGNAGYVAAAPLFKDIAHMLLDNFGVTPKRQ